MNIDERLEALVQTVELIAGMQRDNEARMTQIEDGWVVLQKKMGQLTDTMNRVHDERLDDLERDKN